MAPTPPSGNKKKVLICSGIIAFCLLAAAVSYWQMSDAAPEETPKLKAAEAKAAQIQAAMDAEQKKQPQPPPAPPPPPGIRRGSVAPPK
jgi:CHASE3 domain sensor protein